jgi:hypothetical protein
MSEDDGYEQLLVRARTVLSAQATSDSNANLKSRLEQLASALVLEWIVGERRFESQGQQTEYWLFRFYQDIFKDEQPDATRIYERFGLGFARAAYLARLLRARRTAHWRAAARAELQQELNRYRERASADEERGRTHIQEYEVNQSPGAADELRLIYNQICETSGGRERPKAPKPRSAFGNSRLLAIPAETLLLILGRLQAEGVDER